MDEPIVRSSEESCKIPEQPTESCSEHIEENYTKSKQELSDSALENNKSSQNGSEYESIDTAESSSDNEGLDMKMRTEHSENELDECGLESEGSVILEREEGDGQESVPIKKVDDDEDKKNPQYIPKRGTFYEHDDRTLDEPEKQENAEKNEKQNKKNVWMEKKERWSHDRYNDNEQAPKSRSELVAIYGYDIRNEDGPPRARRRRRYGRGPNKYTRTWEDEDAYKPSKPIKTTTVKKSRRKSQEEYPPLTNKNNRQNEDRHEPDSFDNDETEEPLQNQNMTSTSTNSNASTTDTKSKQEVPNRRSSSNSISEQPNNRSQQRVGTGRIMKPKPEVKKEIKDSDYRGFTKTRQFRNSKSEQKILPKPQKKEKKENAQSQSSKQNSVQDIEKDLNKMNIQDGVSKINSKSNSQRQASVPPRLQGEQKGSKRYSSLRQRSLPETAAPPFTQANYYTSEYNQQTQAPQQQQSLLAQPNPIHATTPQVPQIAPPPLPPLPQQVPVTATPILQAPPQFASPFPQAPAAFLQPTVPPPPFLSQQPPPIINYVQGQPQFPQPPPFQGYQHQQFNTVTQPAELYQCQGGTTYYSTQNQHIGQRTVPQKRPKAAIPIVPPPPQEPRGRGRISNQRETPPAGEESSETVTINNENSSSFEDAVAVQQ